MYPTTAPPAADGRAYPAMPGAPYNPGSMQMLNDPYKAFQPKRQVPFEEAKEPIHTVFFFNLNYTVSPSEFAQFAEQFGEVAHTHSLIDKKGQAFVTYYDIRCAQRAVAEGKSKRLGNREVGTNFAFKNNEQWRRDPYLNCATVIIKPTNPQDKLTLDEVTQAVQAIGEFKSVEPLPNTENFTATFYDTRKARAAVGETSKGSLVIEGKMVSVELYSEEPMPRAAPRRDFQSPFMPGQPMQYPARPMYPPAYPQMGYMPPQGMYPPYAPVAQGNYNAQASSYPAAAAPQQPFYGQQDMSRPPPPPANPLLAASSGGESSGLMAALSQLNKTLQESSNRK